MARIIVYPNRDTVGFQVIGNGNIIVQHAYHDVISVLLEKNNLLML